MFFPLKDENPTRRTPYVTIALIAINVVVFLYTYFRPTQEFEQILNMHGLVPLFITHLGQVPPEYFNTVLLSPLTSMFLHGGFMHVAGNMLFLWIFGNNIEDYFGPVKFLLFYLIAGLAADLLFILFSFNSRIPLVGASGAIAGVLGAYLVLYPNARVVTFIWVLYFIRIARLPAKFILGFWFFYQLFMSLATSSGGGGVAWLAHVGGFGFGYLLLRRIVRKKMADYGDIY